MQANEKSTILLVETAPDCAELLPPELADILPCKAASRAYNGQTLAVVQISREEIRQRTRYYPKRIGIGAEEIWLKFPEFRPEFRVTVERITVDGPARGEIRLGDVVFGDYIVGSEIVLYDRLWFPDPPPSYESRESVSVGIVDLEEYDFLKEERKTGESRWQVEGKEIYICRIFSAFRGAISDHIPGVEFLGPHELIEDTNLLELIGNQRAHLENHEHPPPLLFRGSFLLPPLPQEISGAFIVDPALVDAHKFGDAVVGRILAAAALSSSVSGQITAQMRIHHDGFTYANRSNENWDRPYQTRHQPWQNIVCEGNQNFNRMIKLIGKSNAQKFVGAKEDFRIRALDTVEDSRRSNVYATNIAQLWMAIECLLSFKTETNFRLALALSALVPARMRPQCFKEWKKSYDIRSKIVHGYRFRQDIQMHDEIRRLAETFRDVFQLALGPEIESGEHLQDMLMDHVLSGAPEPIRAVGSHPTQVAR